MEGEVAQKAAVEADRLRLEEEAAEEAERLRMEEEAAQKTGPGAGPMFGATSSGGDGVFSGAAFSSGTIFGEARPGICWYEGPWSWNEGLGKGALERRPALAVLPSPRSLTKG